MRHADPYARYRLLRSKDPVSFNPLLQSWILTRYADIVAVLQDPRFSAQRFPLLAALFEQLRAGERVRPEFTEAFTRGLPLLDPPDHTRLRRLVNSAFTQRRIDGLRARIQAIVDELVAGFGAANEIDLVRDLAGPLPLIVITEILGIPAADRVRIRDWCHQLKVIIDPVQAAEGLGPAQDAYVEFATYFRKILQARRREPQDDLVSALVAVEERGDRLSEIDLLALGMFIIGAGTETTTDLIGTAVLALLRYPDERRRLVANPALMPSAIEEFLRFESPVQATHRLATQDCVIDGRQIRAGQLVMLVLGAANRDPERFPNPDRLDLGRQNNDHLAFGYGAHFCLGASLARAQAQIALSTLLERFPDFAAAPHTPEWKRSLVLRGLMALPLWLR